MSEDNLEVLSNKEIHSKCVELGFPNVPVTDTSRKVLIKKIRASLGGDQSTLASSKKAIGHRDEKNSRRSVSTNKELLITNGNQNSSGNKQNTISTTEKLQAVKISNRRKSQQKIIDVENPFNTVSDVPTIILESDEGDDELIVAAKKFEKEQVKLPSSINKRAPSLSKATVNITAFNGQFDPMQKKTDIEKTEAYKNFLIKVSAEQRPVATKPNITVQADTALNYRKKLFNKLPQGVADKFVGNYTPVYDNYIPTTHFATTIYSSYHNEFSDDNDVNEDVNGTHSPFLSRFAQNLERSKLGISSNTHSIAKQSTKNSLHSTIANLERKYKLKRNFLVLVVLLIIFLLFVMFWQ